MLINKIEANPVPKLWRKPLRQKSRGSRGQHLVSKRAQEHQRLLEQFAKRFRLSRLRRDVLLELHAFTGVGFGVLIQFGSKFYGTGGGTAVMENFFSRTQKGALCWVKFEKKGCADYYQTSHSAVSRALKELLDKDFIKCFVDEDGESWYAIDYRYIHQLQNSRP